MNNIKTIRDCLGLTQSQLAEGIGCTQANVGHYEKGQSVPPDAAKRLIAFAKTKGHELTFDDIYSVPDVAPPKTEAVEVNAGNAIGYNALQPKAEGIHG